MPKALIITYYWPPAGGSGVQRWLKFVKYFREFGWEPVIYTAENPEAPVSDVSLQKDVPPEIEVIQRRAIEPYSLYKLLSGRKNEKINVGFGSSSNPKGGLFSRMAIWIRGNLFIPDARMLWIRPSIRFLSEYLRKNKIDIIISTGPPHSMHLIARGLKRKFNIPWIADFRDPWTNIDFYKELKLSGVADRIHHRLEKSVVQECDYLTIVTKSWGKDFEPLKENRVIVIPNGFDQEDYQNVKDESPDTLFTINHFGVVPPSRNCPELWKAIKEYIDRDDEFGSKIRLKFYGHVDHSIKEEITRLNIDQYFEFIDFIPHKQVANLQRRSQVLLLLVNNTPNSYGIQTGKVFEYLAAERPILAVGPTGGDSDQLITETGSGMFLQFNDQQKIKEGLKCFWEGYKNGWTKFDPKNISCYSRKELTREMASLMNKAVQQ